MKIKIAFLLILILLAACQSPPDTGPSSNATATTPPPTWQEAVEPVTLQNVNRIEQLGRLDTAGEASTVFAYDSSPDSTRLAGLNNTLLLSWDLLTGNLVFSTENLGATRVYYSSDKTEIYTVDEQAIVTIYSDQGVVQNSFRGHTSFNSVLAFYADNGWMAFGGSDGTIKVWDTFDRISLTTLEGHNTPVTTASFSSDGTLLATGSIDGMILVWDWETQTQLFSFSLEAIAPVRLAFAPDSSQLAVATSEDIRLFSLVNGTPSGQMFTGSGGSASLLKYSPDGQFLINGGSIPDMQVWNPQTAERIALLPGVGAEALSADFSFDSTMLLTTEYEGEVTLWNMTQINDETIGRGDLDIGTTSVLYAEWSEDSRLMMFIDAQGPIYLWGIGPSGATQPTSTPAQ